MDHEVTELSALALHFVGNKSHEESLTLAQELVDISDETLRKILLNFFTVHFNDYEYHNLDSGGVTLMQNPIYASVTAIFENPDELLTHSLELSRHLFANSTHPNMKGGDFYVAHLKNVTVGDELTDAIGLYKAESVSKFLKSHREANGFSLSYGEGLYTGQLDKGCLIYNTDRELGYRLSLVDNISKGLEAKYWRDQFLSVKPAENEFFHTGQVMEVTKSFVNDQMPLEFEMEPKDRLAYLDRSIDYFKNVPHYSEEEFADAVFNDLDVTSAFKNYREEYEARNNLDISPSFELDEHAVKKKAGKFKSIIKLDKNFHIYIHGDRSKIERGTDEVGRKFYRIFYNEEM
ncbi:MAG: nucleoid-associated protein [Saprospiraceae bacterium]|nr:nucleoid-associated protein [Saprospiraceae bacterium]